MNLTPIPGEDREYYLDVEAFETEEINESGDGAVR